MYPQKLLNIVNKKVNSVILSIVFTILILYLLFQYVSLEAIWINITKVSIKFVVIAFFFHLGAYFARGGLLYFFLKDYKVNYFWILSAHFIQNFFVHLIPASLGELSFPFLIRKRIPYSNSLSSLILTKLIITLSIVIGFIGSGILIFREKIFYVFQYPWKLVLISVISCIVLVLFWFISKAILKYKDSIKSKLIKKAIDFIIQTFLALKIDLKKIKSPASLILVILLAISSIVFISMFYLYILKGLNVELNIVEIVFISSIGIAFMILPLKSIGGFGTTEGSWAIGMILLGFPERIGILSGFVIHIYALINVIIIFLLGAIGKWLIFRD